MSLITPSNSLHTLPPRRVALPRQTGEHGWGGWGGDSDITAINNKTKMFSGLTKKVQINKVLTPLITPSNSLHTSPSPKGCPPPTNGGAWRGWTGWGLFLFLAFFPLTLQAQGTNQDNKKKEKTVYLSGYVSDSFTKAYIPKDSLTVLLLRADSTLVDTVQVHQISSQGFPSTYYYVGVPAKPAKYIIKATHPEYETTCLNYEIKYIGRNRSFQLPALRMKRNQKKFVKDEGALDEVVVKATRVKMVYKGDTIVYNADAFNVPQGSMLDALIKQLPGVELREGGEIYVNGKKVENLTLNGADFFKGKNKMMLENLPYYTVKNVQVFNKQTPKSKYYGTDVEQKVYTMDVVLKREYNVVGTAFVEGGYGTDHRYKAKGFGLRYSDHSRAVIFGGANNVNEYIDFDREGNDRGRTDASGNRDVRQLGGLWAIHTPEERVTNSLDYNMKWEDNYTENRQQSENYLAGESTFGQSQGTGKDRPFRLNVNNNFQMQKPHYVYSWLSFYYNHGHRDSESMSLTAKDVLFNDSINQNLSRSMGRSDAVNYNMNNQISFKLPWGDYLEMGLAVSGDRTWNGKSFSQDKYKFFNTSTIDQRNQYYDTPSATFDLSGNLSYRVQLSERLYIAPSVGLGFRRNDNDTWLYRLDRLGEAWAVDGHHPMGIIPSAADSLQLALDRTNSSEQQSRLNIFSAGLDFQFSKSNEKSYYYIIGRLTEKFQRNHMRYDSDMLHAVMNKNYRLPEALFHFAYSFDNYHKSVYGMVQNSSQLPDIGMMVDITSTNNPLNIRKGNPDLKPMSLWYMTAYYSVRKDSIDQNINIGFNGTLQHNSFANAYTYDPATGVYTTWTENINGNWNISSSLDYNRALGKNKYWHIGSSLNMSIGQSTDMASMTGQTETQLNRVTSTRYTFSPNLRYQRNKLTFTVSAAASWQHLHRSIEVSTLPKNVYDYTYGINANYQFPWNLTIDTDLTMHSRRGYAEADMNDNRLYWDATLTKSWKQGRWVAKIKGYDLLGQVTQWQYYVNSQGRYETWTNNMRRYVMLSLAYRFTLTPKK